MSSINKSLFFILIKSTACDIEETGVTSLCDALKSNTTLKILNFSRGHKRRHKNNYIRQFTLFQFMKPIGNELRNTTISPLINLLETNSTITELNLKGSHKRRMKSKHQLFNHLSKPKYTGNDIRESETISIIEALTKNMTLTKLTLSGDNKRNKDIKRLYMNNLASFCLSVQSFKRKQYRRHRNNITQ